MPTPAVSLQQVIFLQKKTGKKENSIEKDRKKKKKARETGVVQSHKQLTLPKHNCREKK